jgi:hypothetical protein
LQTEAGPRELYSQVCVCAGDLNLLPSEEEMKVYGLLRPVEDHNLGFTQVDRQLSKVAK